jgi:predicted esterase
VSLPSTRRLATLALLLALSACVTPSASGGRDLVLGPPGEQVQASVYESPGITDAPVLVVVLHGDAPILRPAYQYEFASKLTRALPNVVAVGLLRPGYADPMGRRSDPADGAKLGDNYTPQVSARMEASVRALQARYHPSKTILVGHSGGGAVVANMLEAYPDLAQGALIASCPCDLAAWRLKMASMGRKNSHQHSLSPLDGVARLPFATHITIMVGAKDNVVGVENSRTFYRDALNSGAWVGLEVVPGAGHMMMDDPAAVRAVRDLIAG